MKRNLKIQFTPRSQGPNPYYYSRTDISKDDDYYYKPLFIIFDSQDGIWIDCAYPNWKMMVRPFLEIK